MRPFAGKHPQRMAKGHGRKEIVSREWRVLTRPTPIITVIERTGWSPSLFVLPEELATTKNHSPKEMAGASLRRRYTAYTLQGKNKRVWAQGRRIYKVTRLYERVDSVRAMENRVVWTDSCG